MTTIASRDLRNHTTRVLEEVAQGGSVTITVHGTAVAEIRPVGPTRREALPRGVFLARLRQADPGLRDDLRMLAGDTTDDLGPL